MTHKPIKLLQLSFYFPHTTCFQDFTTQIHSGSKIAVIGRNGSGKSSLLKMLAGKLPPTTGTMSMPADITSAYVPQVVDHFETLSGGQRFQKALTQALAQQPDLLLLDEPTNHLDARNRKSLMRLLSNFDGTLIIATHDTQLLNSVCDTLWHIDQGSIRVFSGNYEKYLLENKIKKEQFEKEIKTLNKKRSDMHEARMKEQHRAKRSKLKGEKSIDERRWPTIVSKEKARRANTTAGRLNRNIRKRKEACLEKLDALYQPPEINVKFSLTAADLGNETVVCVQNGSVGYDTPVVSAISMTLTTGDHIALTGDNGSGKTTLLKALGSDPAITRSGDWSVPDPRDIGYLDQHYAFLEPETSVIKHLQQVAPDWQPEEYRKHLNNFLFRKNEEVNALVATLSGGEKARLSLALIAATTPKLLLLDEVTNNLDLETKNHVIHVLKKYPGTLVVISHDRDFLDGIGIDHRYEIETGCQH